MVALLVRRTTYARRGPEIILHDQHGSCRNSYIMRERDFADLRALAAIVQHGKFARAAAHLRVSPSGLSQTIRGLEERLGVRLLNRTTRSVAPTDAGLRL